MRVVPDEAEKHAPPPRVLSIGEPEVLAALGHPTRVRMLEAMREPASAASVARALGQPRQRMAFHLKALTKAGLIRSVGTRQQGNFTEHLYQSTALAYVVSPAATWGDGVRRREALRQQHALETLLDASERLQEDAIGLLDAATFEDRPIPSMTMTGEMRFADAEQRGRFFRELGDLLVELTDRYAAQDGEPFVIRLDETCVTYNNNKDRFFSTHL